MGMMATTAQHKHRSGSPCVALVNGQQPLALYDRKKLYFHVRQHLCASFPEAIVAII